jgi:hypothetical protein
VFAACAETGTAVETNGLPDQIDLSSELVRDAIRTGVVITCSTDAHSVRGLQNMELAVATARLGDVCRRAEHAPVRNRQRCEAPSSLSASQCVPWSAATT